MIGKRPRAPLRRSTIALGVLLSLAACSDGATVDRPETGRTPQVDSGAWTQTLDSRPTRATVSGGVVFVTTAGFRYPPQVFALDVDSGAVIAQRTAVGQPYDLLMAPDGRLLVAGDRHIDQPGGGGVNAHDPETLAVVQHADLPGFALSLALVGDQVWVGSDEAAYVLDATTLELVRTVPLAGSATQLAPLPDDRVLAVEGDALEVLDVDGRSVARREVEADGSIVAAVSGTTILVRVPVGTDSMITTYDAALAGDPVPVGVETDSAGGGLLATGTGDVILVDDRSGQVLCLPAGQPPAVPSETDATGVLAELPDGVVLLATASGVSASAVACTTPAV